MDEILQQSILTNFFESYEATTPVADQIATRVQSKGASEDYGWIGQVPGLRKMLGERVPEELKAYKYSLPNEEYEASVKVLRKDIKDDATGKYLVQAQSIGESVKEYPDEVIFGTLLPAGATTLCYDGQYFFDTDHPIGDTGAVQSNKLTLSLTADNFATARLTLRKLQGDKGKLVNKTLDLKLVVPVELEATARQIVEQEKVVVGGVGVDNPNYKGAEVVVSPELTSATNWYLINAHGAVKAFIIQEREFIPFEALAEGSEKAFWNKVFYYGTYWRGAFGYGLYHKAVGSFA